MRIFYLLSLILLCTSCLKCNHKMPSNKYLANEILDKIDTNAEENPSNIKITMLPDPPGRSSVGGLPTIKASLSFMEKT